MNFKVGANEKSLFFEINEIKKQTESTALINDLQDIYSEE